ncbi:Uncharacterised protein [uncultured archaeon]|nr:Uncharacterised protein [uncultured archaeon]
MRKIVFQNMITLDGYFEGPNHELDWHHVDSEWNEYAEEFLNTVDTLLFGRVTYELMAKYWPTENAIKDDPIIANKMNSLKKIAFSRTLDKVDWNNSSLIKENVPEEVFKLKQTEGKSMAMFGSSNLALTFIENNLIDEYRIMVNPLILGAGHTLLNGIKQKLDLGLIKTKTFKSGLVGLYYQPK